MFISAPYACNETFVPTSECFNVLLDPLQSQTLVPKTKVEVTGIPDLFASTQETPCTQAVVDGNADDRFADVYRVLHGKREVVALVNTSTLVETATVDPERYGQFLMLAASCWTDDVDVKTVLRYRIIPLVGAVAIALQAGVSRYTGNDERGLIPPRSTE